jgi:hypothetical protein
VWKTKDRKAITTYFDFMENSQSPEGGKQEAKDNDRESALFSADHVNCPAWPEPRGLTLRGPKMGRRIQKQKAEEGRRGEEEGA